MWLYYWLAAHGINPFKDVKNITVPPPQMVANMRVGNMDGFCVGEPWNNRAIVDKIGFTAVTTQDIWVDHPEKVLGTTAEWTCQKPEHGAGHDRRHHRGRQVDRRLAGQQAEDGRNRGAEVLRQYRHGRHPRRMLGRYSNGLGKSWDDKNAMKFFNDGAVNFPYLSDGMWFLTQHKRWGLLKDDPDYLAVAKAGQPHRHLQAGRHRGRCRAAEERHAQHKLIDGVVWDGKDPKKYAGVLQDPRLIHCPEGGNDMSTVLH
jgi:nitrate/nitrite transport system substrate-binding protein